jgi:tetratricopeptide (TPR) repeat protein
LLAAYHANRLEEPERTRAAFEATLERYPANGRLHLAYAQWLWTSPSIPPGQWGSRAGLRDLDVATVAEEHLATAIRLEPDLTGQGLELLRRQQVPPERWVEIFPDQKSVRWELLKGFAEAGRQREAVTLLKETIDDWNDIAHLRQAAFWALEWGDAGFALEAARLWQEAERRPGGSKTSYYQAGLFLAKAHLELGETDEAFRVFRAALGEVGASSPVGLDLLCSMANEYYRRGQVVLAQSLFTEATAGSPNHVPSRLGLARTSRRMGNDLEAVEHYQKVLQLEPDNAAAEKELGELLLRREFSR